MTTDEPTITIAADGSFTAPLELAYPYSRTVGPTLSRFFLGLAEMRIEGTVGSDGRVFVPPAEFDPVTGSPCTEWVRVGDVGTVETWSWSSEEQLAWALVRLDGADVAMLHRVDAGAIEAMATGMRVRVRWAEERGRGIADIEAFEPVPEPEADAA